jgi:hypothetical protein
MPDLIDIVPILYTGPFDFEKIKALAEGPSAVAGAQNIREGIVIEPLTERRLPGLGRVQLKLVSNSFLAKDAA